LGKIRKHDSFAVVLRCQEVRIQVGNFPKYSRSDELICQDHSFATCGMSFCPWL